MHKKQILILGIVGTFALCTYVYYVYSYIRPIDYILKKGIQVTESHCTTNDTAVIGVKNIGTEDIQLDKDIRVTDVNGDRMFASWKHMANDTQTGESIPPGEKVKVELACDIGTLCSYKVLLKRENVWVTKMASVQC